MPGLTYLPLRFVPLVRQRVGQHLTEQLLVTNPARLLTLR
jgi:phosphotriesterase-related protein